MALLYLKINIPIQRIRESDTIENMETEKSIFKVDAKTFFYLLILTGVFAFVPLLAIGCGFGGGSVICIPIVPLTIFIAGPLKFLSSESYLPIVLFSIVLSYVLICTIKGLLSGQKLKVFWLIFFFLLAYLSLAAINAKISNARSAAQIVPPIVLLPPIQ